MNGRPGWGALQSFEIQLNLAAAAVVVTAAVVVIVVVAAVVAAAAAVAEDQQQDDDPPPVVTTEATAQTVVITHNQYLQERICKRILLTLHVIPGAKKGAAAFCSCRKNITEFSARPPEQSCRRFFRPSS